ncbi:MAG TPA: nuclease-related domain-containing protein, partial [Acidimicrobiia bacterium]
RTPRVEPRKPARPAPAPAQIADPVPRPGSKGHMSDRRPGQSVAERIAALDIERANWARGEDGEKLVAAELDGLSPDRWRVFHSIPRGPSGTDIDHLVIGVGGVFTLNTKNVSANVWVAERVLMVGGTRKSYLPAAVHEANDVARRLEWSGSSSSVDVRPVLVFTRPVTIKAMPADVSVIDAGAVRRWLESQAHVLTPAQVHEIARVADRPATWT